MRSANVALKFLLELAALGAFCAWGAKHGTSPLGKAILAVMLPLAVAVLWGRFAAPKSPHRLRGLAELAFETAFFAAAAVAIATTGYPLLAAIFAALFACNAAALRLLPA